MNLFTRLKIFFRLFSFIISCVFLLTIGSCSEEITNSVGPKLQVDNQLIVPGKIVRVDNYPLFVMNFEGNYGFENYLRTGSFSSRLNIDSDNSETEKWACTCFSVMGNPNNILMGRNFDYYHHVAMVLYTHPSNAYASLSDVDLFYLGFSTGSTEDEISKSSAIKSAPYYPFDGVNEKGVAIGMMAIPSADPPNDPSKVNLGCLQVIRLVLDYAASTDEAINLIKKYNYVVDEEAVHFMITDKDRKSAIIEFVNKEMKVIYNTESVQVCTNFIISGSNAPVSTPCWRYNKAYSELKNASGIMDETGSMNLLKSVSQSITMWSSTFNLSKKSLMISVGRNYEKIYRVAMPE